MFKVNAKYCQENCFHSSCTAFKDHMKVSTLNRPVFVFDLPQKARPPVIWAHLLPPVSPSGQRDFHGRVSHAFLSSLAQPSSVTGPHEKRSWNHCVWWVSQHVSHGCLQNSVCSAWNKWSGFVKELHGCVWAELSLNICSCNTDLCFKASNWHLQYFFLWVALLHSIFPRRHPQSELRCVFLFFVLSLFLTSFQKSSDIGLPGKQQAQEEDGKRCICYSFSSHHLCIWYK